jgi:amino acid permease
VLSVGLSCVYGGSRTLTALGESGYAPRIFTYVDKWCVRAHARLAEGAGR